MMLILTELLMAATALALSYSENSRSLQIILAGMFAVSVVKLVGESKHG